MEKGHSLTDILNIKHPIIMAPMFLVSNVRMVVEATKSGITGAIPALNYRNDKEFRNALEELKDKSISPTKVFRKGLLTYGIVREETKSGGDLNGRTNK